MSIILNNYEITKEGIFTYKNEKIEYNNIRDINIILQYNNDTSNIELLTIDNDIKKLYDISNMTIAYIYHFLKKDIPNLYIKYFRNEWLFNKNIPILEDKIKVKLSGEIDISEEVSNIYKNIFLQDY